MNKKRIIPYVLAFAIPWLVVLVHSFVLGVWPFGYGELLGGDMELQYIPLYYELWDKVHNGESLFYSWTAMGGYDFYSNMMYYMISPFTLLILLAPRAWLVDMMQFMMILKWSIVPVTMLYYFLHTRYNTLKSNKTMVSFLLAMAFGMGNGMVYFISFTNWMDAMILFPLLLLAVENLVEKETWIKYCILLTLTILCNYYIAFHICIFLVIWFFLRVDTQTVNKVKKFLIFGGSSVLSAMLAGITMLPGVYSGLNRFSENVSEDKNIFSHSFRIGFSDFFKGFFALEPVGAPVFESPNLYCSVACVIVACLFIFVKIRKQKKIYLLGTMLFMTISFFWGLPNLLWHGFSIPNGVYNRFVNAYIFLLLFLALQVFIHFEDIQKKHAVIVGLLVLSIIIATFLLLERYKGFYIYLTTILLFAFYMMILLLYFKKSVSLNSCIRIFVVFGLLELFANAVLSLNCMDSIPFSETPEMQREIPLVENLDLEDGERIILSSRNLNLGMVTNTPTAGGFLSCGDGNTNRFYERLGLSRSSEVVSSYMGGSPLLNVMFNVKYAVVKDALCISDAEMVAENGEFQVYEVQRLAGLGYMVDEDVVDWDVDSGYPFDLQNDFVKKAVDGKPVYEIIYPDVVGTSVDGEVEANAELLEHGIYNYMQTVKYGSGNDALQMEFTVEEDMDLYAIGFMPGNITMYAFIDGELIYADERVVRQQTLHIGQVKKGQVITIVYVPMVDEVLGTHISVHCQFAKFNEDNYAPIYEKLTSNCLQIETMDAAYVKGNIKVDEAGIMMTSIQAVKGFRVLVDGELVPYETIGNAFIGVPLDEGEHVVEFIYETPWAKEGMLLSVFALLVFMGCVIFTKCKRNQQQA